MVGFAIFFITVASLCAYSLTSFYLFGFVKRLKKWQLRLISAGGALVIGIVSYFVRVFALGLAYLAVLQGLCRLIYWIVRRCVKKRPPERVGRVLNIIYRCSIIPLVCIIIAFIIGYFNMNTVVRTSYSVTSEKLSRDYRVVFLSDVHYDTIQDTSVFKEKIGEINSLDADLIILGGDIFDEGTSRERMQEFFTLAGGMKSQYGIYYTYGNHDRQRYSGSPSFTEGELKDAIESNGITILKEDFVHINDDLTLFGREDLSARDERLTADKLLPQLDQEKFLLTIDHQANDTDANVAIGTDLQLSGHTHGGQIFPLAWFPFFYHGYVYGDYENNSMKVFVSSGFAGWGFPIRTQGVSEYVVVELKREN